LAGPVARLSPGCESPATWPLAQPVCDVTGWTMHTHCPVRPAAGQVPTRGGRSVAVQAPADETGAPIQGAQRAADAASGVGVVLVLNGEARESHGSMLRTTRAPTRDQGPVSRATPHHLRHRRGWTRHHGDGGTPIAGCANMSALVRDSRAETKAPVTLRRWTASLADRARRTLDCRCPVCRIRLRITGARETMA
jgi:hypothetical protein